MRLRMTRWSLFLQTLSLLHHFLGLYFERSFIAQIARRPNSHRAAHVPPVRNTSTVAAMIVTEEIIVNDTGVYKTIIPEAQEHLLAASGR